MISPLSPERNSNPKSLCESLLLCFSMCNSGDMSVWIDSRRIGQEVMGSRALLPLLFRQFIA